MGFPPGVAESMVSNSKLKCANQIYGVQVFHSFKKFRDMHEKRFPPKKETKERWETYWKQQEEAKKNAEKEAKIKKETKEENKNPS